MYNECPKCYSPTQRNDNNTITCTKCHYTWSPFEIVVQDMALQVSDLTKTLISMQDTINTLIERTNENTKQIEYYRRIIDKIVDKTYGINK